MAHASAWAVGMMFVVTLALISIVSMYDRGQRSLITQPGVAATSSTGYQSVYTSTTLAWLQDTVARLRQDDRVAEAIRSQRLASGGELPPRLQPIARAEPAARGAGALPAASASARHLASADEPDPDIGAFGKDLTRELVAKYASPDKMVIVSFVNTHYMDFAANWVRHLRAGGNRHFLVGALDDGAFTQLRGAGVPSFDMAASLTTRDFGWGSKVFKQAQQKKIAMFLSVLEYGYDVLLSDIDVMYLRDPFGFFRTVPGADLLVSSDLLVNTVDDDGPETKKGVGATMNVGIIFMRPTAATKALTQEWNEMCSKNLDFWEQAAFNQLVRRGSSWKTNSSRGPYAERIFALYHGKVPTAVLPVSTFCSGHTGFVQRMPQRLGKEAYAVHATFQFSGTNGKRHRMREWTVWHDPPAYYDPPGGLLAIDDYAIPPELLRPDGKEPRTVEQHFALVNYQLARIRSGLVLAELTGRVLIMPRLWCGFDRWWAPHQGRIPGSSMPLPLLCPLDHVFNIEGGLRPELIREYSLLENARTPEAVRRSQHNLTLPAPTSRESVEAALKADAARAAKVLRISHVPADVFQRALTPEQQGSFQKRSMNYLGIWCCIRPLARGKPGHIWYDMMWDVIPHTDRWRQEWTDAWVPRPSK